MTGIIIGAKVIFFSAVFYFDSENFIPATLGADKATIAGFTYVYKVFPQVFIKVFKILKHGLYAYTVH